MHATRPGFTTDASSTAPHAGTPTRGAELASMSHQPALGIETPASVMAHQGPMGMAPDSPTGDTLLDLQRARELIGFIFGSIARHRLLCASIFAGILAMSVAALLVLPRSYLVETKILAQRNVVLPMLGNPHRTLPQESDTPTRLAAEAVMKHENLAAIIQKTDLLDRWQNSRAPLNSLKDRLRHLVGGEPTREQQLEALIGTLGRKMWVNVGEGTVTIGILWPDAVQAYEIVQTAQQNFLDERHESEVAAITESVGILEAHAVRVHDEIQGILGELGNVRQETLAELGRSGGASGARPAPVRRAARSAADSAEVTAAQGRLSTVLQSITELDWARSRRLAELNATLAAQRNTYGPAHPEILRTQQSIRALAGDTLQVTQLRQEEDLLRARLRRLGGDAQVVAAPTASETNEALMLRAALANIERARTDSVMEERQTYARSRLKIAVSAYEDLLERLEAARIELETTRAAFKYRYGILVPAQVPARASNPKPALLIGGGFVLGMMLAVFAALALDVFGGVLEAWQIERLLGVKVLGEARL